MEAVCDGDATSLPTRVKGERTRRRWSQQALSLAAGISEKTVRRLEAGEDVAPETVSAVCAALEIPPLVFEKGPRPPRIALPEEDIETDRIRSALAERAPMGATVLGVDTGAMLEARFGPGYADMVLAANSHPSFIPVFVAFTTIFGLVPMGLVAMLLVATWQVLALGVAGGLALYGIWRYLRRSVLPSKFEFASEVDLAAAYARRMRRAVFSIGKDTVECIELGMNGVEERTSMPLRDGVHRVEHPSQDHLTFTFDLLGGELVVPFVPKTKASMTLAGRIA